MPASEGRRKIVIITVQVVVVILLLAAFGALNAFKLNFLNPATNGEMVVFGGLSAVFFVLFVAVLVLLLRNVLKLYADQRASVMGTRLRTRMLWGAVIVSVIPLVFMFLFSYGLMNRAVDRWFSQDPDEMRTDARQLALELDQYTSSNARVEAESIAASLPANTQATAVPSNESVARANKQTEAVLAQHEITLQNGFAVVYSEGHSVAAYHIPPGNGATAQVKPWLPPPSNPGEAAAPANHASEPHHSSGDIDATILAAVQRTDLPIFSLGDADYALGVAALKQGGTVVVGLPVPYGMPGTVTRFQSAIDGYWNAYRQRRQVRSLYLSLLLMMTSLALFACCWLALHLAKQVTKPVESLADAMQAIAGGNYSHRVAESATEELGELVRSFNTMAADLED